jgi:hypothetical protein
MPHTTRTPCHCWSCRAVLGETDGQALYLSERASIRRPQTIWCACGGATFWRPARVVRDRAADGCLTPA